MHDRKPSCGALAARDAWRADTGGLGGEHAILTSMMPSRACLTAILPPGVRPGSGCSTCLYDPRLRQRGRRRQVHIRDYAARPARARRVSPRPIAAAARPVAGGAAGVRVGRRRRRRRRLGPGPGRRVGAAPHEQRHRALGARDARLPARTL